MDRKEALELVNKMIAEQKAAELKTAITEVLSKASAAPAPPQPTMAKKPSQTIQKPANVSIKAPGMAKQPQQAPMAKIDPKSHLPGTLLDKNGMMSGGNTMGASLATMTPEKMTKESPDMAPPMAASEARKSLAAKMSKCMMAKGSAVNLSMNQSVAKDDVAHAPNSPQDKAHDIVEEGQSVSSAVKTLRDDPTKVKKMLEHLRSRKGQEKQWERSPANEAAGIDKSEEDKAKEISKDAEKAIVVSADKPMKIQENRPGQANEPKADKKI